MTEIKKTPMWIGVEIPTGDGVTKICIGIDQEDGHEVSFCNTADIEEAKKTGQNPWIFDGTVSVLKGVDGFVFDKNHELI